MRLLKLIKRKIFVLIFTILLSNPSFIQTKNIVIPFLPVKAGELRWAGGFLNKSFLQLIQKSFDVQLFIETGTYLGDSCVIAAEVFKEISTIELSTQLYTQACERFINIPSIVLYYGDSAIILPEILSSLQSQAVLWLDGHWSKGCTARGSTNTPIIQELFALDKCKIKNNIILIDDIRFFQKSIFSIEDISHEDYPDLINIIDLIHHINPRYSCWIYGDILIAFTDQNISPTPIIHAMTTSRLNQESDDLLLQAETTISNASDEEASNIKDLCKDFEIDNHGFNRYYHFWYALTLLHRDKKLAYHHMIEASQVGCNRANYYLEKWIN